MILYQVDAFSDKLFGGNPAAVCPLDFWLEDSLLQEIASENNLAETAFFVKKDNTYQLRWFTPALEVNLCGHATLASAHILFQHMDYPEREITFQTKSGPLVVSRISNSQYLMDFPSDHAQEIKAPSIIDIISQGLRREPFEVWKGKDDYMAIIENQASIQNLTPDFRILSNLPSRGLIVTAQGENLDFVSRCFYPQSGIDEDPATGSAHTALTPYWANRLRKNRMNAAQLSPRVGKIECIYKGQQTALIGSAITYLKGEITL